jgi:NitT/TauT family transport system substrate-binding protein
MKMRRGAACLLAAALVLLAVTTRAEAADKIKVTISGLFNSFAAYFIAVDHGYFAAENIDVEFVQAGGGTATPALLSGDVQYSASASAAITAILKGGELKIVFADNDRVPYQLWSGVPAIKTLADLKGKQIGIENRGDTHELAIRQALIAAGMDPLGVVYTPLASRPAVIAAVTSGSLAAASIATDEVERVKASPNAHMVLDLEAIGKTITGGGVMADRLLTDNRDLAKRFLRATIMGRRRAAVAPDDVVAAMQKRDPAQTRDSILYAYKDAAALKTADGTISLDAQKREIALRSELLGIPPDQRRAPEQAFDFSLLKEVNAELDREGWKP